MSFDLTRSGQQAHWDLLENNGILSQTGTPVNLPSALYDPAQIMGAYHDLNIIAAGSSPLRRIDYRLIGAAPNRKWVLTFFEVSLYDCPGSFRNTHQIILNEGTGIIEVLMYSKEICTTWNEGRAMIGIQNFARNQGLMAPGRRASDPPWGAVPMNEGWRFVPAGGASLFRRAELYELGDPAIKATLNAPTSTLPNGNLELIFPNICPPAGATTSYVVKTVYTKIDDPNTEVAGFDTINVVRSAATDLGATATSTSSSCGGAGTGSITASVPAGNGSGNYQYSLTSATGPWQTGSVFNNLAPGNYTVYVNDVNGSCSSAVPVTVGSTGSLQVNFTVTGTSCPGARNGVLVVDAGGDPALEYRIGNNAWQSSNQFTGLLAGSYFVSVRNPLNGCSASNVAFVIPEGAGTVTGTAQATATSCNGVNNGGITVTPSGTGPFEYSLNGGTWQTSNQFTGLAPGNYTIQIRESGLCLSAPIPVTVVAGSGLSLTVTNTPTSCAGVNNGSITVQFPAGTTAPYTIVLDGTTHVVSNITTTFNNISGGTHTISAASDATGCATSGTLTTTVANGAGFTVTGTATPTSCARLNVCSLPVSAQAPRLSPFTASLSPGAVQQTGSGPIDFTGLPAGTYSVTITDANGCQAGTGNVVVASGNGLTVTGSSTDATCTGVNNGTITVNTNGASPFTYVLDGAVTLTSANPGIVFQNVAAGTHQILVTDATGCSNQQPLSVQVGTGTGFTASYTSSPVTCAGGADGFIDVSIGTAGQAPYSFVLNGTVTLSGNTGVRFSGLDAGSNYNLLITDAVGCTFTIANMQVSEPAPLSLQAAVQAVKCFGASDGQIQVTAGGGTAPLSYSLDNLTYQSASVFAVAAGIYTVYVRDANGCTITQTGVAVNEPAPLQAQVVGNSNATCEGGNDGRIEVQATGGTAPYSYSSDNGVTYQSGSTLLVAPGTYTIWVRDANGCVLQLGNSTVGLTNTLQVTPMADIAPLCEGSSVTLQPITNGTQFTWSPTNGVSDPGSATPIVSPTTTTTYSVTIRLGQCSATDDVTVNILPAPVADAGADTEICFGQSYQLQGAGGVSYQWSPATYLSDPGIANPVMQLPAQSTEYSLVVTDANNCRSLQPDRVLITVTPPIQIQITPVDTVLYPGAQANLLASSPATDYTWSPAMYLDNPFVPNPIFTAPAAGTDILYRVEGTTAAGCRGEGTVRLRVYAGPEMYVPTAFTPNGDGKNDLFFPFPVGLRQLDYFHIYNRQGKLMYSTRELGAGWDGRYAGQKQPGAVYVWQIQAVTDSGTVIRKQGTVVLVR